MTSRRLSAIVAGTSFGCITHVPALRNAGFELAALVGTDPDRTARRAEIFDIPVAATSLTEALERCPDVDAVTIATPTNTHAPLVLEALAAGKHVICEKPFAMDVAEAEQLCAAAEASGLVALVGHELRWLPGLAVLEAAVKGGAIGEPRLATVVWMGPVLAGSDESAPDWWTDASAGGGWLGAHGSHMIDHIESTLGEIEAVSGGLTVVSDHEWTADDSYTVHFRTRAGVEGVLQASYATYGPLVGLTRISGTKGTVWVEGNFVSPEAKICVADADGQRPLDIPSEYDWQMPDALPQAYLDDITRTYERFHARGATIPAYSRMAEAFRELILDNEPPPGPTPPTFRDGLAHMRVIEAVRRSAAGDGWVTVAR